MTDLTDKQLIKIATEFRKGILGKRPSAGMCFAVSAPLEGLLSFYGMKGVELVESDLGEINHLWLRLPDGRALDPTADQFVWLGVELPPVYLGQPHPKIHHIENRWTEIDGFGFITTRNRG